MSKKQMHCKDGVCEFNPDENVETEMGHEEEKECSCKHECHEGECHCHSENEEVTDDTFEESEEVLVLKNTIENLEEKLKGSHAELINYRKRKDEEVVNRLKYANQDIIMDIIPVLDNFERALKLQKSDDTNLTRFLDGFKMLYTSLSGTLKKYGVTEIEALGKPFDHNFHEAMVIGKDETKEDGIILDVLLKGYILKDRVIRPAKVQVNKLD